MQGVTEVKPRELELEQLVNLLEREHRKVESDLKAVAAMIAARDKDNLGRLLQSLDEILLQHMLDEEASILAVLIKAYRRERSAEAIKVFREHVRISEMMTGLRKKFEGDPVKCMESRNELESFMLEHFKKEDVRIFPLALETQRRLKKATV